MKQKVLVCTICKADRDDFTVHKDQRAGRLKTQVKTTKMILLLEMWVLILNPAPNMLFDVG